ncbi:MAG: hypothetical protein DLM63_04915 [Solirubrobacterales bacterium]|nr:MAG: hypothetical protein DLM63_04915 [Solirubrobacterales bacterium]
MLPDLTITSPPAGSRLDAPALSAALASIAEGAQERDRNPAFPRDSIAALAAAGALSFTAPGGHAGAFGHEWEVVRKVARADASVSRILDGHLNAVERLVALAPEPLRTRELAEIAGGALWLGVWGADPGPDEGEPARVRGDCLEGVKVFCSGAGGLHRALVLAQAPDGSGPPLLVYVDLAEGVEVDHSWFQGSGMRASESHRVIFHGARVIAPLGVPGELGREPWFSRDAIRTAATWAGTADAVADAALDQLARRGQPTSIEGLAAARLITARRAIDLWLDAAARQAEAAPYAPMTQLSIQLRAAIAAAGGAIVDEATRACGARALAQGATLDRARRDLELFVVQHRLDPLLARAGLVELEARR